MREIIRVMVFDDGLLPHADASIVEALYGFKVEVWDWKRVDLCSDVIYESSPCVTEVSLYSSGNNAVLMGWASSEGLGNCAKFPQVRYGTTRAETKDAHVTDVHCVAEIGQHFRSRCMYPESIWRTE